jgi:predicted secreted protein
VARYVNGRDFKLYVLDEGVYKLLACLTDCSFSINANKIQITSRSTGKWQSFDYTDLSWSGSATGVFFIQLVAGGLTPFQLTTSIINQLKPTFQFRLFDREGYGYFVEGEILLDTMEFSGAVEDFAVFNVGFTGNGALTITDAIRDCGIVDTDDYLVTDIDGTFIVDDCTEVVGEFDPADFSEIDFLI